MAKLQEDERTVAANVPENYRQVIAAELRRSLKDPYSVRDAEISMPAVSFIGLVNGVQGPVVCARLNAKNSFGGYTGIKTWGFAFKSKMIAAQWPEGSALACEGRAFTPFPELTAKAS